MTAERLVKTSPAKEDGLRPSVLDVARNGLLLEGRASPRRTKLSSPVPVTGIRFVGRRKVNPGWSGLFASKESGRQRLQRGRKR